MQLKLLGELSLLHRFIKKKNTQSHSRSLQVYDDEGLLACCALSQTHIQTAGGGFGSLSGHDIQPGEFCPHHTRKKQKCIIWK